MLVRCTYTIIILTERNPRTGVLLGKELDCQYINKSDAAYGNQNLLPFLPYPEAGAF
jgi:hypothetical protein